MNLKKYLPYESYILTTKLPVSEVVQRLLNVIKLKKGGNSFPLRNGSKEYEGTIANNNFVICRIIEYRNSFLPRINGQIFTYAGYTQVKITMKLHTAVIIFMSLWLGIVSLVCFGILIVAALHIKELIKQSFAPHILIPFGMFIFGSSLLIIPFKIESNISKKFLAELLDGETQSI